MRTAAPPPDRAAPSQLIIAGLDDPIIAVANAKIMSRLLPHATMHLHPGGHVDVITNATELAPVIEMFRHKDPGE